MVGSYASKVRLYQNVKLGDILSFGESKRVRMEQLQKNLPFRNQIKTVFHTSLPVLNSLTIFFLEEFKLLHFLNRKKNSLNVEISSIKNRELNKKIQKFIESLKL